MDWIIGLLDVLIWPLTLVSLLIWLRDPIRTLLHRIQRVKYKGVEIEISKQLEQMKDDVDEVVQSGQSPIVLEPRLYALVDVSPASAVMEAWKQLELAARNKVAQLLTGDETYRDPLRRPLDYLSHTGALVPSTATAVRDLRMLRNQTAHAHGDAISREDAVQYAELAARIREQIDAIAELPKVKLTALTLLAQELNHLIDTGKFDDVSIDEVYGWIDQKAILPMLAARTEGASDLSLFGDDGPYRTFTEFYHDQMSRLADGYTGDHRRKWGVENLGLCLLMAWTTELIQRGSGWHPDEM